VDKELLIKNLDITRRTIESYDRSIIKIRQLFFIFLGIVIAGASNASIMADLKIGLIVNIGASIFLIAMAFLFWNLDMRYSSHFRGAVRTALAIERELGFDRPVSIFDHSISLGVTTNLERIGKIDQAEFVIPAKMYLYPCVMFYFVLLGSVIYYYVEIGADILYLIGIICAYTTAVNIIDWYNLIKSHFYLNK